MVEKEVKEEKKQWLSKNILLGSAAGVIILALCVAGYFYYQYQHTQALLQNPNLAAQQQTNDLISAVGRLMQLPTTETPTIATVSDITKLQNQPFFKNAKNGDKLLIFTKAQKAILYRPSENKIIDVTTVNIGTNQTTATSSAKVVLYNGTTTVGLTNSVEKTLITKYANVVVTGKQNASNKYTKTLVVDLSGLQGALATQIAESLGGTVGALPSGETKPQGADILIILGK